MDKVYEEMLSHIPKPTKDHFYACFNSIEEAESYREKVNKKAGVAFSHVLDQEFYKIVFDHKWLELETPQTFN